VRFRVGAGAAVVLVLVGVGGAVLATALAPHGVTVDSVDADAPAAASILVHVLGAVAVPGVYELGDGDRVLDAIAAAGGRAPDADLAAVNLARPVKDGEQLVVPRIGEEVAAGAGASLGDGRVNINTADESALDTLPRVGPALAQRIIAWREANGGFGSVDDLLSVTGVGEATLAGLRDLVTV
jgi:competence protein ComEA